MTKDSDLPGMHNSLTLCQLFVDAALQPLRQQWPDTIIYHYMDDILFAQPEPFSEMQISVITDTLATEGLAIAPEKVQTSTPWKYLGWIIKAATISPQKLQHQDDICTLHDAQCLLGDLQWLPPVIGIPNPWIETLRPLMKGMDPAQQCSFIKLKKMPWPKLPTVLPLVLFIAETRNFPSAWQSGALRDIYWLPSCNLTEKRGRSGYLSGMLHHYNNTEL
ncbi:hypothetical protein DV515_00005382 [Chloebia gouldiae]|uniref:ribonuclease H n=1 Tax=Chloebia gouldiae TaxID=44316 RepID=A0A3L8SPA3_CHLGU|nr:hypothetical protein DV515_00005382 [Chloebia gouldiae]